MANPPAAVIVPVWNGHAYLTRCLDALLAQAYAPLEIVAVDNGSTDGSAELIAERYPTVTLLRQPRNLGFAGACNVGMRHAAHAELRVLLNQDTEVQPGWLQALVDAFTANPRLGLAGSRALYPDGTLQHAGARLDPQVGGRHIGAGAALDGRSAGPDDFDFLSGVSLAISAPAYATIGGLDEGFAGAYFEDVDWCYRVRAAGFELAYVPTSVLIHHEESRASEERFEAIYRYQRNRLRLLLRHWSITRLQTEFLPAEQAWLQRQLSAVFVAAVQRAYTDHLLHLNEMMAWRRSFLGTEAGSADDLAQLLLALRLTYSSAPAFPPADGQPGAPDRPSALSRSARQMDAVTAALATQPRLPRSQVPLIGPLIDWLRRRWSTIGADPQLYAELQRQQAVNHALQAALAQTVEDQRRLADVLFQYLGAHAHETAALIEEIRRLRATQAGGAVEDPDAATAIKMAEPDH